MSERTVSPQEFVHEKSSEVVSPTIVKPVPLPAEYDVPPKEPQAQVQSEVLPPPDSSLK